MVRSSNVLTIIFSVCVESHSVSKKRSPTCHLMALLSQPTHLRHVSSSSCCRRRQHHHSYVSILCDLTPLTAFLGFVCARATSDAHTNPLLKGCEKAVGLKGGTPARSEQTTIANSTTSLEITPPFFSNSNSLIYHWVTTSRTTN